MSIAFRYISFFLLSLVSPLFFNLSSHAITVVQPSGETSSSSIISKKKNSNGIHYVIGDGIPEDYCDLYLGKSYDAIMICYWVARHSERLYGSWTQDKKGFLVVFEDGLKIRIHNWEK